MRSNLKWCLGFAAIGCAAQYLWLQGIPASERHAVGVVLATAACNLLLVREIAQPLKITSRWFDLLVHVLVGTIAASVSYWVLEFLDAPEATINTLNRAPLAALGMTALLTGGWFVGLLFSATHPRSDPDRHKSA